MILVKLSKSVESVGSSLWLRRSPMFMMLANITDFILSYRYMGEISTENVGRLPCKTSVHAAREGKQG